MQHRFWPLAAKRAAPYVRIAITTALVLEIGARLLFSAPSNPELAQVIADFSNFKKRAAAIRFVPDDSRTYRLAPDLEIEHPDGGVTRHNGQGFRADEDFEPKRDNHVRIACVGGSTTYGTGVADNGETYPAQLERILNDPESSAETRYEALNLGVGGYTSLEVDALLAEEGLALNPDIVLIQCAINDVGPRLYDGFRCDYGHFRRPMRPLPEGPLERALFRSRFVLVAGWALGYYTPLTLQARTQAPLPPVAEAESHFARNDASCFEEHIRSAVERCRAAGARVYLLTEAYVDFPPHTGATADAVRLETVYKEGLRQHNAALRAIAAETGAEVIDLALLMPPDRRLFADPIHANAAGNAVKAGIIAERIGGR